MIAVNTLYTEKKTFFVLFQINYIHKTKCFNEKLFDKIIRPQQPIDNDNENDHP